MTWLLPRSLRVTSVSCTAATLPPQPVPLLPCAIVGTPFMELWPHTCRAATACTHAPSHVPSRLGQTEPDLPLSPLLGLFFHVVVADVAAPFNPVGIGQLRSIHRPAGFACEPPGRPTSHRLQPCHDKLQFGVLSPAMSLRPGSAATEDNPPPHHPTPIHLHHGFCHHLPFTLRTSPYPYHLTRVADWPCRHGAAPLGSHVASFPRHPPASASVAGESGVS